MKFIDEKGRIFGLVNYFDLLVILLIGVLAAGLLYVKNNNITEVINSNQQKEVIIDFYVSGVRNVTVDNIEVGDIVKNSETRKVLGEVIEKTVGPKQETIVLKSGQVKKVDIPDKYDMILRVKGFGDVNGDEIMLANKDCKIGLLMTIESPKIQTTPVIYGLEIVE
ncbi:MAG: DUF4330 domain-containing protein [Firmicutes bacterium]|jgi:hypothetical protein|nr:DUF4330 domain-containing protein [Bacillota bacterium]